MKEIMLIAMLAAGAAMASEAVDPRRTLHTACPGLAKYSEEIQLKDPVKQDADLTLQREKGWAQVYSVRAVVSDQPKAMLAAGIKAQGQWCTFDVDARNGQMVAVSKVACMSVCVGEVLQNVGKPYVGYFGTDGHRQFMN